MKSEELINVIKAFLQDRKIWEYHGKAFLEIIEIIKEYANLQQQNSQLKEDLEESQEEKDGKMIGKILKTFERSEVKKLQTELNKLKEAIRRLWVVSSGSYLEKKLGKQGIFDMWHKQINTLKAMIGGR